MAATHLLDTSVYCQPIRRDPLPAVVDRWTRIGEASLAVSALCEAEVRQGLEARDSDVLWSRYDALLDGRLPVIDIGIGVAHVYGKLAGPLIRRGQTRPVVDLLIAATAKHSGLIVATLNVKHFTGLPGVAVEDWSEPL